MLIHTGILGMKEHVLIAAKNGHLDCFEYAHTQGCPWNKKILKDAIKNNKNLIITYIQNLQDNLTI
jgi:hypothetical protein